MVSINTLLATLALALTATATPLDLKARDTCPGQGEVAAGMSWFAANVPDCKGKPFDVNQTYVPQTGGPTHPYLVGKCYPKGNYGSVFVDTLRTTCSCK
jgi:hypothetical protein